MFVYTISDVVALVFLAMLAINGLGVVLYRAFIGVIRYLKGRYG